jgi:hypothetical protein
MSITTQDSLVDRTVSAMTEALLEAEDGASWLTSTARTTLGHLAAELIVHEQQAGYPLTLQDAVKWICQEVER